MGPVLRFGGAEIRTGTCSWTDPTLVKGTDWYPRKSMSAAERLAFYAAHYPVVEVDSTYYWPPTPQLASDWVARTPAGFVMDVKAYGLLTGHPVKLDSLWEDMRDLVAEEHRGKKNVYASHLPPDAVDEAWARFEHALAPLEQAGKLGGVLFQYPEWFIPKMANQAELEQIRSRFSTRAYVELRSPRWWAHPADRRQTLALLRANDLTHVVVDAPPSSGLPVVLEPTTDAAVVRFHGRNDENWKKRNITAAERFDYLYGEDELRAWTGQLQELAGGVDRIHALMNNCHGDKGVRNAADLAGLLGAAGAVAVPPG